MLKNRKILVIIISAVVLVFLAAGTATVFLFLNKTRAVELTNYTPLSTDDPFTADKGSARPEVTLDGVLDETNWQGLPQLVVGEGNIGKVAGFYGENGIYIGIEIQDENLWSGKGKVYDNTSFELYINTEGAGGDTPGSSDLQMMIGLDERILVRRGTDGKWVETSLIKYYAVSTDGTVNDSSDKDNGYAVELFIPYSQLSGDERPDYTVAFGIVGCDENGLRTSWSGISGVNVQIPSMYYVFERAMNGFVKPPKTRKVDQGITLDGIDSEQVWTDGGYYFYGDGARVMVKTVSTGNGIYFYFVVKDKDVWAKNTYPHLNDSVEIYLDTLKNGGNAPQTDDYQIRADAGGNIVFLRGNGSAWEEKSDNVFTGVNVRGTLNNGSDLDSGYNMEVFIPWSDLNSEVKLSAMKVNFGLCSNSGGEKKASWSGTGHDPQVPNTYILMENRIIGSDPYLPVASEITLDGSLTENQWSNNTLYTYVDGAAALKWFWTDKGVYFGFTVRDNSIFIDKNMPYDNDAVEIYLDYNNNGGSPAADDRTIIVDASGSILTRKGARAEGSYRYIDFATPYILSGAKISGTANSKNQAASYSIEVFVPWTEFGKNAGRVSEMGIALGIVSRDDSTGTKSWQSGMPGDVQNPATYYRFTSTSIAKKVSTRTVATSELSIDGSFTEGAWSGKGYYSFGRDNSTGRVTSYFGSNGIYFSVKIADADIWTDSRDAEVDQDDAVQFYIRTDTGDTTVYPTTGDYQIRINAAGDYLMLKGNGSPNKWEAIDGILKTASVIYGTVNNYADMDRGYNLEIYVPWSEIGGKKSAVKIAFGTREDFAGGNAEIWWGTPVNNEGIQNPNHYLTLTASSLGGHSFSSLLTDEMPDSGMTIDGKADEQAYSSLQSKVYGSGSSKAMVKTLFGEKGIYLYVEVSDTKITRYGDVPTKNDGVGFRIDSTGNGVFDDTDLWVRTGTEGLMWICRGKTNTLLPLNIPAGVSVTGTVNNQSDIDTGYSYEFFIPYTFIGGETEKIGLDMGIFNVDAQGGGDAAWNHNSVIDFENPATYYPFKKQAFVPDADIVIDGLSDDTAWNGAEAYTYGDNGAAKVKSYFGTNGLYYYIEVADSTLFAPNALPHQNDSVEIYLDTLKNGGGTPATDDYQLRADIAGNVAFYQGGSGWTLTASGARIVSAVTGTLGQADDTDTGYAIEIFIPWIDIGLGEKPESLNVNYGLCDNSAGGTICSWSGTGNDPQDPGTYLYMNAYGTVANAEVSVDGLPDDTLWQSRGFYPIGRNSSTGRVGTYLGERGLYFFYLVNDGDIWFNGSDGSLTSSDSVQLYLRTDVTDTTSSPTAGDYQLRVAADGSILLLRGNGSGWEEYQGYVGIKTSVSGTLNDGSDIDSGYCVEVCLPWNQIGGQKSSVSVAFGTVEIYNNGVVNIWWGTPNNNDTIQNPATYLPLDNQSIGGTMFSSLSKYVAPDSGITLDGAADEDIYKNAVTHLFGVGNNTAKTKVAFGKKGLYLFFDVRDSSVSRYSYVSGGPAPLPPFDDGLEFRLSAHPDSTVLNSDDLWVRVGVDGVLWGCTGTDDTKGKYSLLTASKVTGTLNNNSDTDNGYTFEMFVPYEYIGGTASTVGMNVGIFNTDSLTASAAAWIHNGFINFDDPVSYPSFNAAMEKDSDITLDGNESIWQSALSVVFGLSNTGTIKSHIGANGLYLLLYVPDTKISALSAFPVSTANDSVEIYIDPLRNGGLVPQTDDLQIRVDAGGMVYALKGTGSGWTDYRCHCIGAASMVNGTLNNDSDMDVGYTLEVFVPWEELGLAAAPSSVGVSFGQIACVDSPGWYGFGIGAKGFRDPQVPENYAILDSAGVHG